MNRYTFLLASCFAIQSVHAGLTSENYNVTPLDVNGGGTSSMGGVYTLTASTAQSGGAGVVAAGPYQATNGFWFTVTGPSFQGLGDLPGSIFFSQAFASSAGGTVVVGRSLSVSGSEAFRWTLGGGMVGLGDLPGGAFSSLSWDTSADGSVVVGEGNSASGTEAFRWTSGGGMVGLGDLPGGGFSSFANGTSADGAVVVGTSNSASGAEAFRWTSGGGMVGLGDLPGSGFFSQAFATSADGAVVAGFGNSASGTEAFRWTSGGGMVGLGDLPGGDFNSQAFATSADGAVVVGQSISASGTEAFRWTSGGGMVGLGDLPGGILHSVALATSADGAVVVGLGHSAFGSQAFLWTADDGMRLLQDLLATDFGLDLTGWQLQQARGISPDGGTIVGDGVNPDGFAAGWIATLVAPAATDGDGVPNTAPLVDAGADQTVDEGGELSLSASFTDADSGDTHTASIDWGDGTVESGVVNESGGSGTVSGSHVYGDNGAYTVTVSVNDGELEGSDTLTVAVDNVPPTVDAGADQTVADGQTVSLAAASFTDPGFDNGLAGTVEDFDATVDWGDGTSETSPTELTVSKVSGSGGVPTTGTVSGSHVYAAPGSYTVTVTATDDDGGFDTGTFSVKVFPTEEILVGLGAGSFSYTFPFDDGLSNFNSLAAFRSFSHPSQEVRPCAGDIDGDGLDEIVLGFGPAPGNFLAGWVVVLDDADHNHALLKWLRVGWSAYNTANGETWPACGDLDGDGRDEIVIGLGMGAGGWMRVFDDALASTPFAQLRWLRGGWSSYNTANGETRPSCGDVDGDGLDEIVVGYGTYTTPGGYISVIDDALGAASSKFKLVSSLSSYNTTNGETRPACGDVDGDGTDEVVVGFGSGFASGGWIRIIRVTPTGFVPLAYRQLAFSPYNSTNGETRPALGDVDGDGREEIVVGIGTFSAFGGLMAVFDDAATSYAHIRWLRVNWPFYNSNNGETWPTVGNLAAQ